MCILAGASHDHNWKVRRLDWIGSKATWNLWPQWPAELVCVATQEFGHRPHYCSGEPPKLTCPDAPLMCSTARAFLLCYGLHFFRLQEPSMWRENLKKVRKLQRGKVQVQWEVLSSMLALALLWCPCKTSQSACLKKFKYFPLLFRSNIFKATDEFSILSLLVLLWRRGASGQPFLTGTILHCYD